MVNSFMYINSRRCQSIMLKYFNFLLSLFIYLFIFFFFYKNLSPKFSNIVFYDGTDLLKKLLLP